MGKKENPRPFLHCIPQSHSVGSPSTDCPPVWVRFCPDHNWNLGAIHSALWEACMRGTWKGQGGRAGVHLSTWEKSVLQADSVQNSVSAWKFPFPGLPISKWTDPQVMWSFALGLGS